MKSRLFTLYRTETTYCTVCLHVLTLLHNLCLIGIPAASEPITDIANFHGTVVDDTGVHGQVYAC